MVGLAGASNWGFKRLAFTTVILHRLIQGRNDGGRTCCSHALHQRIQVLPHRGAAGNQIAAGDLEHETNALGW
ncbi:hypothetical protein D9M68_423560 [compost metagenome]